MRDIQIELVPLRPDAWPPLGARGYLSFDEEEAFQALSSPKRQRDWLSGRLASKLLIAKKLETLGHTLALTGIEIKNDDYGVPYWTALRAPDAPAWPLSISHSRRLAAAAVSEPGSRLGIDVEIVEERNPAWLEIAFHPEERACLRLEDPAVATRAWTVKEAVLKFLGLGLRADLWDVRCGPTFEARLSGKAKLRHESLGRPRLTLSNETIEDHVLTAAFAPPNELRAADALEGGKELAWTR